MRRARRTDSSFGIVSSSPFRSRGGYWMRREESPSAAASEAFVLSIVRKNTPLRKSMPRRKDLNWSRIIESAFTIVRPSGDRWSCSGFVGPTTRTLRPWYPSVRLRVVISWRARYPRRPACESRPPFFMFAAFSSSFITTPGITSKIQLMLSLYGRTWIRENSSSRCSPRIEAYRMFVSTPRIRSSYSASRRAVAVRPIGSTKPAQRRAEFSQSRYSGESSSTLIRNVVGVPRISTSGNSSFDPPVPREATVIRSMRPLIAPRASCIAGNSAICPFSRSSRKLTSCLREEPVHHPFRVEGADVLVRLSEVHEDDRLADRLGHGQRRASLRVRVDFRQDDSVDADRLVELFRLLDRVVPREGVSDVEGQARLRDALDLLHLVHQVLVRLHPARGVDQDDIPSAGPGVLDRIERDRGRVRARLVLDEFEADRLGVFLELLDGPRPERVRGGNDARVALLLDMVRELRDRRRLARAVHPDEHDDEGLGRLFEESEEVHGRDGQGLGDRIPQRGLDALLQADIAGDPLALQIVRESVHDFLRDREGDVGFEEGDLKVVQDLLELILLDLLARVADRRGGHVGLRLLLPAGEPFAEGLEHLVPLAGGTLRLEPIVQVLHGRSLGLGAALQLPEPLADRVRGVRDRLDPRVQALDLLPDVVVHEQVGPNGDERLVHVLRFRDEERVRPDRHEDLRPLARLPISGEGLPGPHVLLEGNAEDILLLRKGFDLLAVLVQDRHAPPQVRLAEAHAPASIVYFTA